MKAIKFDEKFIKDVAKDQGITNLSTQQCRKAHNACKHAGEDYYYRLKEYFYA
jgi:hypothetical protein